MIDSGNRIGRPRRGDILLIVGILLAAGVLFCVLCLCSENGIEAVVMQDGRELLRIRLGEGDGEYCVSTDYGSYRIAVRDGLVSVAEAPCPDKICVQHAPTAAVGDCIICLPGRLTVTVTDGEDVLLTQEGES